jgi:hypothetical protein
VSNNSLTITIPLPGGNTAPIDHKPVEHAEKTLGAMTLPDGNSAAAIGMMQEKAQQWINAVRNGKLHRRNVWFSLKVHLKPWIGYGLCSSAASLKELDKALYREYYQILPMGRIVRTTPVGSRTVDAGFFGVGLPHLRVEALIAMSNKLLTHYGCQMAAGKLMQTSYSLLFLELGLSFHPLQESYNWFKGLVTHSWVKMLWENYLSSKLKQWWQTSS